MIAGKLLITITFSSIFSIIILIFRDSNYYSNDEVKLNVKQIYNRKLYDRSELSDLCLDINLTTSSNPSFNNPNLNLGGISFPKINFSDNSSIGAVKLIIMQYNLSIFLETGNTGYLVNYIMIKVLPYVVFFIFTIISFLGLFYHYSTCCCPYLCCVQFDGDSILACCSPCTVIANLVFSILSILACIVGFSFAKYKHY